ncbi:MAG TPA: penicillin acylase family protein [Candidatus Acidoferrales bacterium]|nr:penicillin acylase family protein [Candidatus Acidoferrales bacterium]
MTSSAAPRIVRTVNIAIGILLLVGIALIYWFVWRPLPERSGSIAAPISAPATVRFDTHGEPHIQAASIDDALFLQGYVTAQDRLWQMDGLRRFAGGTLAEILGPAFVESDQESRRMRMRRIAEEAYVTLPPGDRAAFAAYGRGVNHFIATHRDRLPVEFGILQYQPRPWSTVDSLLICLYMFRNLTTTWKDEVVKNDMIAAGDRAKVDYLFPMHGMGEESPGSNAWVLAGRHTASGKPLLSNDPHLEFSVPGIWLMMHLEAPGLDVAGVALPGAPGVVIGHNRRIAWGVTNLHYDVQDLYRETLDQRTGQYVFQGKILLARAEREIIRVKGGRAIEVSNWVTVHGPVFLTPGNEHLTLRWAAAEHGLLQFPFVDIDRAGNWEQFTAALARFPGPGSNFVYADVDGNIGYHAAGALPIRRTYRGDLPVDGASGNFEWQGFIPFGELPAFYNPPSGMIVTANQNPFPEKFPYAVNGNFGPPYRSQQIRALLRAREGWRAADMLRVQTDLYSAFMHFLSRQVVEAYQKRGVRNPGLDPAIATLREWNGQMYKDLAAPYLITLIYQRVRRAIAENASSAQGVEYVFNMAPAVVERMLRERPSGWFADYDAMLLRALADAVEEGSRAQGHDVTRWHYGAYLRITISKPVIHQIPLVGKYFDIGPVPMSGATTTVKQTSMTLMPSMRMTADLADWEQSLFNLPIGQSGQILSSHYRDQWDDYLAGRSYPMQFGKIEPKSTLAFHP